MGGQKSMIFPQIVQSIVRARHSISTNWVTCGTWYTYIHTYIHTYILNWPLPIGAFQGQWNTTKRRNKTTTIVKNPNRPEANQLAIYKCSWEVEPGTTRIKFNEWSEQVLNPGSPVLKASTPTTGPHCLLTQKKRVLSWVVLKVWKLYFPQE